MRKLTKSELTAIIRASMQRDIDMIARFDGSTNPQVIAIVNRHKGRYEALCDIDYLLNEGYLGPSLVKP